MKNDKGFLKTIILIIIALALIKLVWDFDILKYLNQEPIKAIWNAIVNLFSAIWNFLKGLFSVFG